MLIELFGDARGVLQPLFRGNRKLHGALTAALSGDFGRAWADSATAPRVAVVEIEFYFVAGDAEAPAAEEVVRAIPRDTTVVAAGEPWDALVRSIKADAIVERTRIAYDAGTWDRARLGKQAGALPPGHTLTRIGAENVDRFAALTHDLVANYRSTRDFAAHGVGFGVEREGRFVAGCTSFTLAAGKLEFEIQTHPDFRRRGLATAAAAAMILHCIDNGLEPCWDAHNEGSALLAEKLGFVNRLPYTVFALT